MGDALQIARLVEAWGINAYLDASNANGGWERWCQIDTWVFLRVKGSQNTTTEHKAYVNNRLRMDLVYWNVEQNYVGYEVVEFKCITTKQNLNHLANGFHADIVKLYTRPLRPPFVAARKTAIAIITFARFLQLTGFVDGLGQPQITQNDWNNWWNDPNCPLRFPNNLLNQAVVIHRSINQNLVIFWCHC